MITPVLAPVLGCGLHWLTRLTIFMDIQWIFCILRLEFNFGVTCHACVCCRFGTPSRHRAPCHFFHNCSGSSWCTPGGVQLLQCLIFCWWKDGWRIPYLPPYSWGVLRTAIIIISNHHNLLVSLPSHSSDKLYLSWHPFPFWSEDRVEFHLRKRKLLHVCSIFPPSLSFLSCHILCTFYFHFTFDFN